MERNIRSLKNITYRYLEEKKLNSYIENLGQFVNTINSRVNRVTKLVPNRVTKKDVAKLVSPSAQTSILQKPKFYNADFVRIVKKDEALRKRYKKPLLTRCLRLQIFRRCHRQSTRFLLQTKKNIEGKFYQPELQLVREGSK